MIESVHKYISTGGIGDSFIVFLKLQELIRKNPEKWGNVDWLHVESMNFQTQFYSLMNSLIPHDIIKGKQILCNFEHDPNYIENFQKGKWTDRESIPTSFNRECLLHRKYWPIDEPFLEVADCKNKIYDIVIQVSAGQKNNKQWLFNPLNLADLLSRNFGYKICLIGNDEQFKQETNIHSSCFNKEENVTNEVCKYQNLSLAVQPIWKSKLFIGLSGFLNYFACACKIPNIHLIEGEDQELDYYHEKWKSLTYGIKSPTLVEVMQSIRYLRSIGIL